MKIAPIYHIQYIYLAVSAATTVATFAVPNLFLRLMLGWGAVSFWLVTSAYFLNTGRIFRKRGDGSIPGYIRWLFIPVLLLIRIYNLWARKNDVVPPLQKIDDRLFLARRPVVSEIDEIKACGIGAVLDVTAEFSTLDWGLLDEGISYLNIPVLDHKPPNRSQLIRAVNWIHGQVKKGRSVMIHCALGRGRSVMIMAAYLISREPGLTAEQAVARINKIRVTARLNRQQRKLLNRICREKGLVLPELAWIIANPASGGGKWAKSRADIIRSLSPYFQLEVKTTETGEDIEKTTREAVAAGADVVIACGGDGTVSKAAAALVNTRVVLGIIPLGTTNALSHVLWGLRSKLDPVDSACDNIIQGRRERIDTGACNGHTFLLVAGIGFEQQMMAYAGQQEKDNLGQLAYIKGLLRAVSRNEPRTLTLRADNGPLETITTTSLVAANAAPLFTLLAQGKGAPDPHDGLLDITWIPHAPDGASPMFSLAELALSAMEIGFQGESIRHAHARELEISSPTPLAYVLDGEAFTGRSLSVRILPSSLNVLLPADDAVT
ncbi:MAG: diacylglycerol kinase family protein [Desulfobacter sp.]